MFRSVVASSLRFRLPGQAPQSVFELVVPPRTPSIFVPGHVRLLSDQASATTQPSATAEAAPAEASPATSAKAVAGAGRGTGAVARYFASSTDAAAARRPFARRAHGGSAGRYAAPRFAGTGPEDAETGRPPRPSRRFAQPSASRTDGEAAFERPAEATATVPLPDVLHRRRFAGRRRSESAAPQEGASAEGRPYRRRSDRGWRDRAPQPQVVLGPSSGAAARRKRSASAGLAKSRSLAPVMTIGSLPVAEELQKLSSSKASGRSTEVREIDPALLTAVVSGSGEAGHAHWATEPVQEFARMVSRNPSILDRQAFMVSMLSRIQRLSEKQQQQQQHLAQSQENASSSP